MSHTLHLSQVTQFSTVEDGKSTMVTINYQSSNGLIRILEIFMLQLIANFLVEHAQPILKTSGTTVIDTSIGSSLS